MESGFVTMTEAAAVLGISRATMWRRVKGGEIEAHESQIDRRRKLIRKRDVEALATPIRLDAGKAPTAQCRAA